jgi:Ni/Fe-hydrogenase subunit HybB-like protein
MKRDVKRVGYESPRGLTHPMFLAFAVLMGTSLVIIHFVKDPLPMLAVTLGLAGYCIGWWNKHEVILEEAEEATSSGSATSGTA